MRMNVVRNILAVIVGFVVGSAVNMAIVMVSGHIIPPPAGADVTTMEGLTAALPLFRPHHFLMPFLAHALGTFAGAWLTALVAANHKFKLALVIGLLFLAGGIANTFMLPSPTWFTVTDLALAYIPMAFIAGKLVMSRK